VVESRGLLPCRCGLGNALLLDAGHHAGDENQQRRPDGEGVVLLIGGDGEEEQRPRGKKAEQPDGARAKTEIEEQAVCFSRRLRRCPVAAADILHPLAAGLPGQGYEGRQKQAPGKNPHQVQQPVGIAGQLVVVVRIAQVEEAQIMLIDEVEVKKAVDVADGGVVADGVSLVGIGQAAENVPGRGDGQKEQRAGDRLQLAPASPQAGDEQIRDGRANKKGGSDEPLGEQSQRQGRPHPVKTYRAARLKTSEQAVQGNQQKEAQLRLRNDEAGKEKRPDGGEHAQAGIESGARTPGATRPQPRQPCQAQHGQRIGQMRGKDILAEDLEEGAGDPVGKRRLFNVADAIDMSRDPVAVLTEVLRGLGVGGVHVVQQRRVEQRGKIHGGKNDRKKQPHRPRGKRGLRASESVGRVCHGLVNERI
jgi:hypothetical protein